MALSRGDAWAIINLRQNAGQDERKALPPRLTLRQVLRILWNRPDMAHTAVWGDGLGLMAFDAGEEVLLSPRSRDRRLSRRLRFEVPWVRSHP